MSETTFDGTLISKTSFDTLRFEDSLAKRVSAFGAEKATIVDGIFPRRSTKARTRENSGGHRG